MNLSDEGLQTIYYGISKDYESHSKIEFNYSVSLNAYLKITSDNILIVGQTDKPISRTFIYNDNQSLGVKLPLGSINKIFNIPACELTNIVLSFEDIKSLVTEKIILEQITKLNYTHSIIQEIEKMLRRVNRDFLIEKLLENIIKQPGLTANKLSSVTGYSNRHLQRLMLNYTGFTPKKFLNILRFQKSFSMIEKSTNRCNICSIAHENGYYDQSHMIKEFKRFSGYTPNFYIHNMSDLYNTNSTFYVKLDTTKT
jgi:AraC-like DNA-binding protein